MKNLKMKLAAVPALVLASGGAAMAAIDPAITTAISTAQTDSLALAGILTAMVAVIWGALFLKKKFFG